MILFFALTSFFSLFMHLIRRCSRRSSKDFIDVSPNFTANSFSGRFGNERDPLVPNGIPSNSHHYSRIYRYGPAPPSKTSHCSAPGVSEHDRLSRVREAPSLPEPSRRGNFNNRNPEVDHLRDGQVDHLRDGRSLPEPSHRGNFNNRNPEVDHLRDGRSLPEPSRRGNFNNRNPEVDHLRVGRETPALSQPSHHGNRNSRNTSQTWCNFVPGRSHNDLPWRVPETPPPTHHGNRTNRNNLDASRSYTYRHPDDQQIQGGPNHVFPAFGTTSVPASAPDTRASGAPPPPYTRFPAS
ncbi:hypothetical protein BS47DRAFT_1396582 [Hydnum rufescens UP504]|uniref:Uncharacterized protein n=1 Tax=Hydnum rufescens UP504 TaxID=1448309 RepID=A0A9P6DP80_9AGAM|nr:hypothetical protein BS47DRAFT_1396582 [Hydnum rufescens UP504]